NFELLMSTHVQYGLERQVTRQSGTSTMLSWGEEHCLPWPIELIHMPGELVVHEHSCTVGGGRDFQLHGCGRNRHARVLFQRKVYGVNFSRLKQCLFDIVLVPSLANHD